MYNYPITFSFGLFSLTPQISVTDAAGKALMAASKKLISSKDEIHIMANGSPLYHVISQESRITDIPSNWDITTADGKKIGIVDDDFLSAIDTSSFSSDNRAAGNIVASHVERALHMKALKMYWLKDPSGKKAGLIAPEKSSIMIQQLPLHEFTRKIPFFFRFITPGYYIRLGNETVMFLQKQKTLLVDTYKLETRGKFSEQDEMLIVPSVVLALLYERQRLKDLFED